mmetsp:Transcript_16242/g.37429  ORF Transcript_16242/g.37429 Transcript_16242/m.37429 type:complete len:475 (+) Transcript_16242:85-1509(+)
MPVQAGRPGDHLQPCIRPADVTVALKKAVEEGHFPSVNSDTALLDKPVALVYDLDAWEGGLQSCIASFGPNCLHAIAFKSNAVVSMLQTAVELGLGAECASIGEVLHAQAVGFPLDRIVFDSPCKTRAEILWALQNGLHLNIDNLIELERVVELVNKVGGSPKGTIGLRINPLVGAGQIAALSVSTSESKFGISCEDMDGICAAYSKHAWLTSLHVHTGSGGMALQTLVSGVQAAIAVAKQVNDRLGRRQITVLDIGGGLPANYLSDDVATDSCPSFADYAEALRKECPGLLAADDERIFDRVVTEFGQSLNAKGGFLASRVEYTKLTSSGEAQVNVIHFGADTCVRQFYTKDHKRRLEFYDGTTCEVKDGPAQRQHVAGPLCFQGDMLKDVNLPSVVVDDFVVMREAGANTLSIFSRHCARQAPKVLGYRRGESTAEAQLCVLKDAEDFTDLVRFWGGSVPADLVKAVEQTAQ